MKSRIIYFENKSTIATSRANTQISLKLTTMMRELEVCEFRFKMGRHQRGAHDLFLLHNLL